MAANVVERDSHRPTAGVGETPPPSLSQALGEFGREPGAFDSARVGLLGFLATVTMLFLGFTSAYILRRSSADWRPLVPPSLLWLNSALLLASSGTLETARRRLRGWDLAGCERWAWATGLLGAIFVAGQLAAWRQLARSGVYLASNPSSSFFYVLTGAHGLHLAGGIAWFGAIALRLRRMAPAPGEDGLGLFALYWHFLAGLWLYLLALLFAI